MPELNLKESAFPIGYFYPKINAYIENRANI